MKGLSPFSLDPESLSMGLSREARRMSLSAENWLHVVSVCVVRGRGGTGGLYSHCGEFSIFFRNRLIPLGDTQKVYNRNDNPKSAFYRPEKLPFPLIGVNGDGGSKLEHDGTANLYSNCTLTHITSRRDPVSRGLVTSLLPSLV